MTRHLRLESPDPATVSALAKERLALTPNARAAKTIGAESASLDSLAKSMIPDQGLALASPLQAERAFLAAARQVPGVTDPEGAASSLSATVHELFRSGADLDALSKASMGRPRMLAGLALAYREALRAQGLASPSEVLWLVAQSNPQPHPIVVYGYPRLGHDEAAFIEAIAAPGSVVFLPFADAPLYADNSVTAQRFEANGWTLERAETPDPASAFAGHPHRAPHLQAHEYPNMEAEVRGILAQVKELLVDGEDPGEIALVARDDTAYGPTVLAVAWEYDLPVRAFYRLALTETRIGSWLHRLAEAFEYELACEPTWRLRAHSLSPWLDSQLREKIRLTHPQGLASWKALDPEAGALDWPDSAKRGTWNQKMRQLLAAWKIKAQAAKWPVEMLAYYRLQTLLKDVCQPADERVTREAFLAECLQALALYTLPAHPGRGGVELHTPLSLFGARLKHVYVLGAAEDRFPARIQDDPVLDFHARKRLVSQGFALEVAAEAARREQLSMGQVLEVATERLTFSYPKLYGDRQALPSSLFHTLGLTPARPAQAPPASRQEARRIWLGHGEMNLDERLPAIARALEVERRREAPTDQPDRDPYDGFTGIPLDASKRTFSASQLSTLGQCAFKWFVERALKAKPLEEASDELDPSLRGDLYHKALERGVERCAGAADLRQALLDVIEAAFKQAEAELSLPRWPHWDAMRDEHLALLKRAIKAEPFLLPGAQVEQVEYEFTGDWQGFKVVGKIDRVDIVSGKLVLVDYKAGKSTYGKAQDADGNAKIDLQLPIYVQVGGPALGKPVDRAYYYLIGSQTAQESELDQPALDALATRLKGYLADGFFPVQPDLKQDACTFCDSSPICRKGPRLERKARHP